MAATARQRALIKSNLPNVRRKKPAKDVQAVESNGAVAVQAELVLAAETEIANKPKQTWGFQPGVSGNPSGRPKFKLITEALRYRLQNGAADELAGELLRLAIHAKSENARVAALGEITDRVEGKAVQAHRVEAGIDGGVALSLADLAAKLTVNVLVNVSTNVSTSPLVETPESKKIGEENQ